MIHDALPRFLAGRLIKPSLFAFLSVALLLGALTTGAVAQQMNGEPAAEKAPAGEAEHAHPTTQPDGEKGPEALEQKSLGEHMEALNVEIRALRTQLMDAKQNADSLERVVRIQLHALMAKNMRPTKLDYIKDEQEQAKMLTAYRTQMANMIADMMRLEVALLADDNEKAGEYYKAILEHRFLGHNAFRIDD